MTGIEEIHELIEKVEKLDKENLAWAKPGVCFIAGKNRPYGSEIGIYQVDNSERKSGINYIYYENGQIMDGLMLTPRFDESFPDRELKGGTVLRDFIDHAFIKFDKMDYLIGTPKTFHDYVREALDTSKWKLVEVEGTSPDYAITKKETDIEKFFGLIKSYLLCKT